MYRESWPRGEREASLTKTCFVSQCRRTFSTRIVVSVLTIIYSVALCSLELKGIALLLVVVPCIEKEPPPLIKND
jgi:hypothetical protein